MLVIEGKNIGSYSGKIYKNVEMPEFCESFYKKNNFVAFTDSQDLQQALPVMSSSMVIEGFEVWFSGSCNLKCSYCYFEHVKKGNLVKKIDNILFSEARFAMYLKELKFNHIFLSGGEPLLYPTLLKTMNDMMVDIPEYVDVRIPTNGTFINEVLDILQNTQRMKFLISIHLENKNWEDLLRKWEKIKKEYPNKISIKILISPGIENIPKGNYEYSLISPVANENRSYSLEDLNKLVQYYDKACLDIFNENRTTFVIGMDTGCLRGMIYETLPTNRFAPTSLKECLYRSPQKGFNGITKNFKFELAGMRDHSHKKLSSRPLLLSHCGEGLFLKSVDMEKINKIDAFVNTLCLQFYIRRGLIKNLLEVQQYYYHLHEKIQDVILPHEVVDVAIDIHYELNFEISINEILTVANVMGWKINKIINGQINETFWLDKEGEPLIVLNELNYNNNDDLICYKYKPKNHYISFYFIGRQKDIIKVLKKEAKGIPNIPNKYYIVTGD